MIKNKKVSHLEKCFNLKPGELTNSKNFKSHILKKTIMQQIDILEFHIKEFRNTSNIYHLFALISTVIWVVETLLGVPRHYINLLRYNALDKMDENQGLTLTEQLENILS
jgi:hypothetical protein